MADITQILRRIETGESSAGAELLDAVYDELRRMAAVKVAREKPGHTLQATALVHEVYLRIAGGDRPARWESRRHYFLAAAEAMRRILVESARRKSRLKHGGGFERVDREIDQIVVQADEAEIMSVHEALDELASVDAESAEFVKLHYFTGMTIDEAAHALGISERTAYRDWAFARTWLKQRLDKDRSRFE